MNPAWTLQRNAQAAPNSTGRPKRLAGIESAARWRANSNGMFSEFTTRFAMKRCRSVSIRSGSKLLMVTLSAATSRDSALHAAVRAVRAEDDRAMSERVGDFTRAD